METKEYTQEELKKIHDKGREILVHGRSVKLWRKGKRFVRYIIDWQGTYISVSTLQYNAKNLDGSEI